MVTIKESIPKDTNIPKDTKSNYNIWSALANNSYSFEQALNAVKAAEQPEKKQEQPAQPEQPEQTPEKKATEPEVFDTFTVGYGMGDRDSQFKKLTGEDWPGVNYYAESNGTEDDGYDDPIETWTIYKRVQEQPSKTANTEPEPAQTPEQSPVPPEVQSQIDSSSPEENKVEDMSSTTAPESVQQPTNQPESNQPEQSQKPKDPVLDQAWHPKLSEDQIYDLVERGIDKPEGPEYEQAISEFGLKPIVKTTEVKPDEPKWHPKLSQEQIDDLVERGIDKPEGPEYEQALIEMVGLKSLSKEDQQPKSVPAAGSYFKPATDIEPEPIIATEAYPGSSAKGGEDSEASAEAAKAAEATEAVEATKTAETAETVEEDEEERKINEDAEYFKDGFKPEMVEDENGKFSEEKHKKFTERIKGFVDRISNKVKAIREKRKQIAARKKEIEERLAQIKGNASVPEQNPAPAVHEDDSEPSAPNPMAPNFKPAGDLDDEEDDEEYDEADDEEYDEEDYEEYDEADDEVEDDEEDNEANRNFEDSDSYEEYVNEKFGNLGKETIEFLTSTRLLDKPYAKQILSWWTPAEPLNDEARNRIIDLLKRSRGLPEGSAVRELLERLKVIQYED